MDRRAQGWGVPIGTDTAFALGIITLFGSRVRPVLLVFLTAFSIVDDILAVAVIAIFYTEAISIGALAVALALMAALVVANRAGWHRWPIYAVLGGAVWVAVLKSGVHATAAGVLVALVVPARSRGSTRASSSSAGAGCSTTSRPRATSRPAS